MGVRKIYFNDLAKALCEQALIPKFETWADKYYPDASNYFSVLEELVMQRGAEQLYHDIMVGKFEEELDYAPRM